MRAWGGIRLRTGGDRLKRLVEKAGGGQGTRGAHPEHLAHVRDALGAPAGYVRIEILQARAKSSLMSVMAETSQSATGPYVAMAPVGSVLYSWTAASSGRGLALVMKGCTSAVEVRARAVAARARAAAAKATAAAGWARAGRRWRRREGGRHGAAATAPGRASVGR